MKRILSLLVLGMMFFSVLTGCSRREIIPIEYTSEVLVDKELPDESLVWAGKFETPSNGMGLFPSSESRFFGIVEGQSIRTIELSREKEYIQPYGLTVANGYIAKFLKTSRKELRKKFNKALYRETCSIWEDVTLFHFYVDEENTYEEGKSTEYAGKYVFIEYREESGDVYMQAFTPEQYNNANRSHRIRSDYTGRIGDIYYLSSGYYDLSAHSYKCYESEADLPKYKMESGISYRELLDVLRQDEVLAEHLNDEYLYNVDKYYILNDRIYAAFVTGANEHYQEDGGYDKYEGSTLILVMLDAENYEVLYAEKYHSTNYYMGARSYTISMYQKGEDGFLYDPYIVE